VGETQQGPVQLSFNGSLRVDFQGARVTSDGGLLLVRELDEQLGFGALIERHLADARGKNTPVATDRPGAAVGIQSAGGTRMLTMPSGFPKTRPSGSHDDYAGRFTAAIMFTPCHAAEGRIRASPAASAQYRSAIPCGQPLARWGSVTGSRRQNTELAVCGCDASVRPGLPWSCRSLLGFACDQPARALVVLEGVDLSPSRGYLQAMDWMALIDEFLDHVG